MHIQTEIGGGLAGLGYFCYDPKYSARNMACLTCFYLFASHTTSSYLHTIAAYLL